MGGVFTIIQFCFLVFLGSSFSCDEYSGGQYPSDFCKSIACVSVCSVQSDPESCMDTNYVNTGFCKRVEPSVHENCRTVVGVQPEWTEFCQTKACSAAKLSCASSALSECKTAAEISQWVLKDFQLFCKVPTTLEVASTDCSEGNCRPRWARVSRELGAECAVCPFTLFGLCPVFHWTETYATLAECEAKSGECWATKSWSDPTCALCPNPQGNQCPAFHWTKCYDTEQDCINASGSNCKKICRKNTLGLRRPKFNGPSCYNQEYGRGFGPNWVPTGKTSFEKYFKTPTQLYVVCQTTSDDLPWLKNRWHASWGLQGCDAAAAVYENIVCAIEILTVLNKTFVGPRSGAPGNKITDFLNNGDEQVNLRELAAFFSQAWKEVARMQVWEEAPTTAYADCTVYPCGKSLYYQGRGPVQLSWNYNYGPFSEWFYNNKFVLLDFPDHVDPEGPMGFIAYFWFWFTPRDFTSGMPISGTLRMRDAIVHWTDGKLNGIYRDGKDYDSVSGLGLSTNVVNGGVECSRGSDSPLWRVMYFLTAGARIGVKIPNMNDGDACRKDKFCNGLFSGCTATATGATCEPKTDDCGLRYVDGWTGKLCSPR